MINNCTHCDEPIEGAIIDTFIKGGILYFTVECEWCSERMAGSIGLSELEVIGPLDRYTETQADQPCWPEDD